MAVVMEISFRRVKQVLLALVALVGMWIAATRWIGADVVRLDPNTVRVDLRFVLPVSVRSLPRHIRVSGWPEGPLKPNLAIQGLDPFHARITVTEKPSARGIPFVLSVRDLPTITLFPTVTGGVRVNAPVHPRLLTGNLRDVATKGPIMLEFDSPIRQDTLTPANVKGLKGAVSTGDKGLNLKWRYYPSPAIGNGRTQTLRFTTGVKGIGNLPMEPAVIRLRGAPRLDCTYVSPRPGQEKVWFTRTIKIDFNQPLKDGMISVDSLPGKTEVIGNCLRFSPEHALLPRTRYTVRAQGVSEKGERRTVRYGFTTTDIGPMVWADVWLKPGGACSITLWEGKEPYPGAVGFTGLGERADTGVELPEATLYVASMDTSAIRLNGDIIIRGAGETEASKASGVISLPDADFRHLSSSLKKGAMVILHR